MIYSQKMCTIVYASICEVDLALVQKMQIPELPCHHRIVSDTVPSSASKMLLGWM